MLQTTNLSTLLTTLVLIATFSTTTSAQNCYYPNGDISHTDAQCSSKSGVCCPYQWECLSNGLCSFPSQGLLGRYTCTDKTWASSDCTQLCTQRCIYLQETPDLDNTSSGAVAIRKCNDGKYCCNDNAGFDCCNKSDTSFFKLSDGSPTATILSIPPASSLRSMETSTSVSATKRASSRISTTASSITKSKSSPDRSQTTTLASATPTDSGDSGDPEPTATDSEDPEPTSTDSEDPQPTSTDSADPAASAPQDHTGLIIGMAVVIPIIAFALCLLFFFLARRTRRKERELDTGIPVTRVIEVAPEPKLKPAMKKMPITATTTPYQQPVLFANGRPLSDRVDTPQPTFMESFGNSGLVMTENRNSGPAMTERNHGSVVSERKDSETVMSQRKNSGPAIVENKIGQAYSEDHGYASLVSSPESPLSPVPPMNNMAFAHHIDPSHEWHSPEEPYSSDTDSAVSSVYEIRR